MANKSVWLKENTRVLLNKAHSKVIAKNPDKKKPTDNDVIKVALEGYLGDKNGR